MSTVRACMLAAAALLLLAAAALGAVASAPETAPARPLKAKARGSMRIADSSGERSILSASALAPGETVRGRVQIGQRGSAAAGLVLSALNLRDTGGAEALSKALSLTIRDVTRGSAGIVYSGSFAGLGSLRVGALGRRETRTYDFAATLPETAAAGLAGASTTVEYRWRLTTAVRARCATRLRGTQGNDLIVGTVGGDRIRGAGGADRLYGGARSDCLDGGPGSDRLFGNGGKDRIVARDGTRDLVACGRGADVAIVDRLDVVRGCEKVRRG
ncbi:MAG: hypothetical protein ACM3NV_05200 [Syntrophothermus sp.]